MEAHITEESCPKGLVCLLRRQKAPKQAGKRLGEDDLFSHVPKFVVRAPTSFVLGETPSRRVETFKQVNNAVAFCSVFFVVVVVLLC
ncbi:MAG: hypothetical protein U1D69_10865 [Polynucleobacter sp.]|nr:hypothetical protein [Polynucleobacter sp.]